MAHDFKVGQVVWWRGGWGLEPAHLAKITAITPNGKNGRTVVDLDNGHWAYLDQLSPLPENIPNGR